jgi:hypothetical protein
LDVRICEISSSLQLMTRAVCLLARNAALSISTCARPHDVHRRKFSHHNHAPPSPPPPPPPPM